VIGQFLTLTASFTAATVIVDDAWHRRAARCYSIDSKLTQLFDISHARTIAITLSIHATHSKRKEQERLFRRVISVSGIPAECLKLPYSAQWNAVCVRVTAASDVVLLTSAANALEVVLRWKTRDWHLPEATDVSKRELVFLDRKGSTTRIFTSDSCYWKHEIALNFMKERNSCINIGKKILTPVIKGSFNALRPSRRSVYPHKKDFRSWHVRRARHERGFNIVAREKRWKLLLTACKR